VEKVKEVAGTYELTAQTVRALCDTLGIPVKGIVPKPSGGK
jgi:hypothetical protein